MSEASSPSRMANPSPAFGELFYVAQGNHLFDVAPEEEIESPRDHDAQFLHQARQLRQINAPPHPPGNEPGELKSEEARHAGVMANARQHSHGSILERLEWFSEDG